MKPLDGEQVKALLGVAKEDRLEALFYIAIYRGLRIGEMLALRWQDLDMEHGVIRVEHTLTRKGSSLLPRVAREG